MKDGVLIRGRVLRCHHHFVPAPAHLPSSAIAAFFGRSQRITTATVGIIYRPHLDLAVSWGRRQSFKDTGFKEVYPSTDDGSRSDITTASRPVSGSVCGPRFNILHTVWTVVDTHAVWKAKGGRYESSELVFLLLVIFKRKNGIKRRNSHVMNSW